MVERARMRGRNETAARLFVEENLNLSGLDAYRMKVVEFLASSIGGLLATVNGFTVTTHVGSVTLKTKQ
ncbi:MAG: hypothetical protein QW172_01610 [Candidatus Bathyarchaeia archaeon]